MATYFKHEKLAVYGKLIDFHRRAMRPIEQWPKGYAVTGQFSRASESMVTNLVIAVNHPRAAQRTTYLEYSLGSVLECAACLDIATVRNLLAKQEALTGKRTLSEIARMQIGLRKSWVSAVKEEGPEWGFDKPDRNEILFPHESLKVYQRAIELFRWAQPTILTHSDLRKHDIRKIDDALTSLILNIAEGNGRFSSLDHHRFIETAHASGMKLAAHLDMLLPDVVSDPQTGKRLLCETTAMLVGMMGYLSGDRE